MHRNLDDLDVSGGTVQNYGRLRGNPWEHMRLASAMGITDDIIKESIPLFFIHQYPQHMYIYREAFLGDYFENRHGGKHWSFPLLYAVSALGAAHSENEMTRSKSTVLAKCAYEILLTDELARPSPATIQALLCLAFHELGQGNSSLGWTYAGRCLFLRPLKFNH